MTDSERIVYLERQVEDLLARIRLIETTLAWTLFDQSQQDILDSYYGVSEVEQNVQTSPDV